LGIFVSFSSVSGLEWLARINQQGVDFITQGFGSGEDLSSWRKKRAGRYKKSKIVRQFGSK
jgi:hypothetical protein